MRRGGHPAAAPGLVPAGPARAALTRTALVLAALVLAALVLVAGCSSAGKPPAGASGLAPMPRQPTVAELTAAARLPACPAVPAPRPAAGGLPDLTLPCLGAGPSVRLSALRGTPTVLNLWASWCTACETETPRITAFAGRAKGRLRVLGVVTRDTRLAGLGSSQNLGIRYPSVLDEHGRLLARTGHRTLPVTLFVDRSGRVVHTEVREIASEAQLRALTARYLGVRL